MAIVKVLLLLSLGALVSAAPNAHVVVVIGQSNSVGLNGDGHTAEDTTFDNIKQTSCCVSGGGTNNDQCQLVVGQDPLHHQCDDGFLNSVNVGFGMTFARQLRAEIPAEDVIILVPAGVSGTGFVDNVWTAYTGSGFQQAVKRIQATFRLITQNYPQHTPVLRAYLWHQGESDAGATSDFYLNSDIIPMINAWRDTNLIPQTNAQVPFVVGNLVPGWLVESPNALGVSTALQLLDQQVPYSASTPSQGLVGDQTAGTIHFSAKSQRLFGKRYYAAFKLAQLNSPV